MRTLLLLPVILAVSCGPTAAPSQSRPDLVAADSLVETYLHGKHHYDNRRIQVYLAAKSYRLKPDRIEAQLCEGGEMARFYCSPPPDTESDLIVTGICKGKLVDGIKRCEQGVTWCVVVDECYVTAVTP